jgi:hypothetical protein
MSSFARSFVHHSQRAFATALSRLKEERRYRVFADLERARYAALRSAASRGCSPAPIAAESVPP